MTDKAQEIWHVKVDRYRQRGQKVDGFQDGLRVYCEIEAELNSAWGTRNPPSVAMINAHRAWSAEFFDTPSSQKIPANGGTKVKNKFAVHADRRNSRT